MRFPNLDSDDIIIPGMTNLSFNIKLSSMADPNRMLASNIGRAIMKKLAVKSEGNEILGVDISMRLRVTETCGRQSLKSRMQ